jgi:hypothetical protein
MSAPSVPATLEGASGAAAPGGMPGLPPGFDPKNMDPAMMKQMANALQRLPKGQLMRMQQLMQRAMAGKDVSKDAAELEKILPPGFQQMMMGMMGGGASADLSEEEAKKLVAQAAAQGKISSEEAVALLGEGAPKPQGKLGQLWGKIRGK